MTKRNNIVDNNSKNVYMIIERYIYIITNKRIIKIIYLETKNVCHIIQIVCAHVT